MIFETHAHYDDDAYHEDRDVLLASMQENQIGFIVNVGASLSSTAASIALAEKYSFVYAAAGVHPSETTELNEETFAQLEGQCMHKRVVAVGEIGLDYYWEEPAHEIQKLWFARQLEIAKRIKKPVIVHSREAAKDTYDILAAQNAWEIGGVIHCFSYGVEMAEEYIKWDFTLELAVLLHLKMRKN